MHIGLWLTWPTWNSPPTPSIHLLDDDSLLHVFYLYRPFILGEDQDEEDLLWGGDEGWASENWWYMLAHVCQRWRKILLGSASYLELSLVCTNGTPVADMLAHSPPLPLLIDYRTGGITTEDEDGIILAFKQRDRVRRVSIQLFDTRPQKIIEAIEDEYPILEYLLIGISNEIITTTFTFPETLQAPHLRHLILEGFALPIGSRLLSTAVGLVTLFLNIDHASSYFHPNTLLQWLSVMPLLETLMIIFSLPLCDRDVARQLTHTPIIMPVQLPNLHRFTFQGVSNYLEALLHRVTTPRLKRFEVTFFKQLTFSVPRLPQSINATGNLRFDSAGVGFNNKEVVLAFSLGNDFDMFVVAIIVKCWHLDWQVSSIVQIFEFSSQMFSALEHLTLKHEEHSLSSEEHNEVDRTEWRRLLSPFRNVKTLRIDDGLVERISRCLQLEDGEHPLELLPELQELRYSGSGDTGGAFASFISARHNAGHPVNLVLDQDM